MLRYGRLESCLSIFDSQEEFCLVTHALKDTSESHISQHFRLKRIAYPGYLILIISKVLRDKTNQCSLTKVPGSLGNNLLVPELHKSSNFSILKGLFTEFCRNL